MLADLDSLTRQFDKVSGKAKSGDKASKETLLILETLKTGLEDGKPAHALGIEPNVLKEYFLLTAKPIFYVATLTRARIRLPLPISRILQKPVTPNQL